MERRSRAARRSAMRSRQHRLAALAVLVLVASVHTAIVWPGRMSADTLTQISLVRTGEYTDWHAALLLVLWRPFWLLGVGPGWVTWASTVTFLVGLYALLRAAWPWAQAVGFVLVMCAYPPVLGHIGYLGRDFWYTALFLVAAAAMVRLARSTTTRSCACWLSVFVAGVWLMVASRQNGLPVAGVLFLGVVSSCGPWRRLGRFDRRAGSHGRTVRARALRVVVAFVALLVLMAGQSMARRALGVQSTHPEQATFLYDVAALSVREHQVLFSPDVYPGQDLQVLEQNFSTTIVNPLLFGAEPPIPFPVPADHVSSLRRDWLRAVREHPLGYLKVRWALWEHQVAWKGKVDWIYHPFVDPNPWGYEIAHPSLDEPLQDYLRASASDEGLHGGPLYEVWVYLALTVAGLAFLRHRLPGRQVLGWCCLGSLAYQATIFVGAMGVGYRLAFPSVVLAIAVAGIGAVDLARMALRRAAVHRSSDGHGAPSDGHGARSTRVSDWPDGEADAGPTSHCQPSGSMAVGIEPGSSKRSTP